VERANQYLQTSFLPGRVFTSPADFNTHRGWLPRANQRLLRRTGTRPALRVGDDTAAMMALPPMAPRVGMSDRVRLGRDYYVRVLGNDYSVDPTVIGRLVDITAGLTTVTVFCAGQLVAAHQRCWDTRRTITDPTHVANAAQLRQAYRSRPGGRADSDRPSAGRGPGPVGLRRPVRPHQPRHRHECQSASGGRAMSTTGKDLGGEVAFLARELRPR